MQGSPKTDPGLLLPPLHLKSRNTNSRLPRRFDFFIIPIVYMRIVIHCSAVQSLCTFHFIFWLRIRSFKFRFRTMKDGQIRRWRAGKRHNAHLKVRNF